MAKKKDKYVPKSFESNVYINVGSKKQRDTSANIYESMLLSEAWQDLTPRQKILYIYCKAQYYGEKNYQLKEKDTNPEIFTMNQCKWHKKYKLYSLGNRNQFYKDMEGLITHGFIKCVECGAIARQKNIYAFNNKWKMWGTNDFEIETKEMTWRMLKKI